MSDPVSSSPVPPPVLILTPPGLPGATLAAALGRNPAGYGVPELNLEQMTSTDQLQRELIGFRAMQLLGLFRAIAQIYGGEQTGASVEMARRWLNRRAYLPTARVAQELVAKIAPRRMIAPVTSAIFDGLTLKHLGTCFPQATYVHLTAHPRAFGTLIGARPEGEAALMLTGAVDESVEPAVPDPQELWLAVEEQLEPLFARLPPERVVQVDAIALIRDPRATLKSLAQALDLPAHGMALTAMQSPEASVFAGPGPLGAPLQSPIRSFASLAADLAGVSEAGLDGPVPWRDDATGLTPEVQRRAKALGYG